VKSPARLKLVLCEQAVQLSAVDDAIEDVRGCPIRLRAARHHAPVVAEARKLLEVGGPEGQAPSHVIRRADEVYVVDRHGRMLPSRSLGGVQTGVTCMSVIPAGNWRLGQKLQEATDQ